jgi:hypothetical protein
MTTRLTLVAALTLYGVSGAAGVASAAAEELAQRFVTSVRPFLETYCLDCHSGPKAKGDLDLSVYRDLPAIAKDHATWATVRDKLAAQEMPPKKAIAAGKAKQTPRAAARQVVTWIEAMRREEALKTAGDPGVVLARRLSNAEYNYTVRDLTGVDIQPTREFPVDPTNPAGFDNSGESLAMSPALLGKYLQAARDVANHLVLRPNGLAFAPHLVLVDTDRDKYCVKQIVDFYQQQDTNYAHYFQAAWRFKHRAALGQPKATLASIAARDHVSPKYLATVWRTLEESQETVGPLAKLQAMWRALPAHPGRAGAADPVQEGCERMRTFVVQLRQKIEPRFAPLSVPGLRATAQPFLMWKNRQYATHRTTYDTAALQIEGAARPVVAALAPKRKAKPNEDDAEEDEASAPAPASQDADPDLQVPPKDRALYEAAFARFAAAFPDAFYVAERGRNYLDPGKERGRLLSAGFHNLMGYFRDDQPLYDLVLDDAGRKHLDELWQDLDFVADAAARTFTQFFLSESGEARGAGREKAPARGAGDAAITSAATVEKVAASYLGRARPSGNPEALRAIEEHFTAINGTLRWVERARKESEPRHLEALVAFAGQAYRRPLTGAERDDLLAYYRSLREQQGLDHQGALRDAIVSVLMSPDFCYRIDLAPAGAGGVTPLSDSELASRLSYFLWSSMPDEALLARAAAGQLREPKVLVAEVRRMLRDERAQALATEFGGNWLDFRRFQQHNAVDRERFPAFDDGLREAMFEEPIRFLDDVVRNDRSVLDLLYGQHTFVNPVLARHYGIPGVTGDASAWVRVPDAIRYGRGGLLPMAVFLTQNAPGLRTSPVKRGYWLVRRVLGEQIPPPPAVVPELPHDEAKLELPLREVLARHREDAACAGCHARFDALGLAFEGYGPVGELRTKDLAGRPVDAGATFPGGQTGSGLAGVRSYIRTRRQDDFEDSLCRKLLVYALGRSLMLSDEPAVARMRARLRAGNHKFAGLVEEIVQSPQFLGKRGRALHASAGQEGN